MTRKKPMPKAPKEKLYTLSEIRKIAEILRENPKVKDIPVKPDA